MANGYARIDLIGQFSTIDVINTLWYLGEDFTPEASGVAEGIAARLDSDFYSLWLKFMHTAYLLSSVQISLFTEAWAPTFITPPQFSVGQAGLSPGETPGPAMVAIVNFTLSNLGSSTPAGHGPVRRSYLAVGPIPEAGVSNVGQFLAAGWPVDAPASLLAAVVTAMPAVDDFGEMIAIRCGAANLIGGTPDGLGLRSYARVSGASFRPLVSYRRSRAV